MPRRESVEKSSHKRTQEEESQKRSQPEERKSYLLNEQIGFLLRQASQRHAMIFAQRMIKDVTPTQWAALARIAERGPCSQNRLGRLTAMDAATVKGVVERLSARGYTKTAADSEDLRRLIVALTPAGRKFVKRATSIAHQITEATLATLNANERRTILKLLGKIK
jgi:DNA-binding MarR family transcriptional regulator